MLQTGTEVKGWYLSTVGSRPYCFPSKRNPARFGWAEPYPPALAGDPAPAIQG
jgi:hypothetical protein